MNNFSRILVNVPVGDPDDLMDAYAALNNLLINTRQAVIMVNMNFGADYGFDDLTLRKLNRLAALNAHELHIHHWDSTLSLAQMVEEALQVHGHKRHWFLNHDCDLFMVPDAFTALSQHSQKSRLPALYQFFDIENGRGYADYKEGWEVDGGEFVKVDPRSLCFRRSMRAEPGGFCPRTLAKSVWTGAFMVPLPFPATVIGSMKNWPSGVRGYDRMVMEAVAPHPILLEGAVAYHKGVYTPTIQEGGRWESLAYDI